MNAEIGTEAEQFLFWAFFSNFRYCVFAVHVPAVAKSPSVTAGAQNPCQV